MPEVKARDSKRMCGARPFVFTNLKSGHRLPGVIKFAIEQGMLDVAHVPAQGDFIFLVQRLVVKLANECCIGQWKRRLYAPGACDTRRDQSRNGGRPKRGIIALRVDDSATSALRSADVALTRWISRLTREHARRAMLQYI